MLNEKTQAQIARGNEGQEFKEVLDADGLREVAIIGNERVGGCPFNCVGCGVHDMAQLVSAEENNGRIKESVELLRDKIGGNQGRYQEAGYHVCVYNEGNATNKEELSRNNLIDLLKSIDGLNPPPKYISLNSRAVFIDKELLDQIGNLNLQFGVNFIVGVESLSSERPEIYGKKDIAKELEKVFKILQKRNSEPGQKTQFGMDAGFVFLPEFYLKEGESRDNRKKIMDGFVADVSSFIKKYVGKGVPTRINLHPYYRISNLPYEDSAVVFNEFMKGVADLLEVVQSANQGIQAESEKTSVFIGVQGGGYGREEWQRSLEAWGPLIERINALKIGDEKELVQVVEEITKIEAQGKTG